MRWLPIGLHVVGIAEAPAQGVLLSQTDGLAVRILGTPRSHRGADRHGFCHAGACGHGVELDSTDAARFSACIPGTTWGCPPTMGTLFRTPARERAKGEREHVPYSGGQAFRPACARSLPSPCSFPLRPSSPPACKKREQRRRADHALSGCPSPPSHATARPSAASTASPGPGSASSPRSRSSCGRGRPAAPARRTHVPRARTPPSATPPG